MRIEELDFDFPEELIAQRPAEPRDSSRLMHLPAEGEPAHLRFSDLITVLRPGDTLVFNDSRVLPARVQARRPTGGRVELLFLQSHGGGQAASCGGVVAQGRGDVWEALARPSGRLKAGASLIVGEGEVVSLVESLGEGRWLVKSETEGSLVTLMERFGTIPLPPYIHESPEDPERYQTVYAAKPGSAAAPTAGLHFTPRLLEALKRAGVRSATVTLHVGLDTFQPIREEHVESHRIHRETYAVSAADLRLLQQARSQGGRIVAVGTTACRVLETVAAAGVFEAGKESGAHLEQAGPGGIEGETDIYITPGYRFRAVDAMLTNFHLPRSSVLAMVMAFAGIERLRAAYVVAISLRYRFFSFGDAMLIDAPANGSVNEVARV